MIWEFPLSAGQVTGRETLTGARPITRIHNAINEIQGVVVTAADVAIQGLSVSACEVKGNTLVIRGKVGDGDLEARVYALEKALAEATVKIDLALSNDELSATGTVTWGGTGEQTESEEGTPVEVTDCDAEGGA